MTYIVGANMVGYLPESDPYVVGEDLTEALRALADEVMRDWDGHEMACDEGPNCETCGAYLDAHSAIHNGSASEIVGYLHYWIQDVPESDAAEYLDA